MTMRIGIIGGGPGGAVTAAKLAQAGHEVHIYESVVFPRFHIGESLLPCNLPIYQDIGLDQAAFTAQDYTPKTGAHFEQAGSGRTCRFPFADALPGDPPAIYQVERARFDTLLLRTAVERGAILHCPVRVHEALLDGEIALVHDGGPGREHELLRTDFDFIVDASGRETMIGRQLGLVDKEGDLMRAAVYGHVGRIPLAPGAQVGDISIAKAEVGWAWAIPLAPDHRWSVGLVLKRDAVIKGGSLEEVFRNNLQAFPEFADRLAGQVPDPVRSTPNISYRVRQRRGRRWALVGDAGGFIDPIFSSGVLLATRAGHRLAQVLIAHGPDADLEEWRQATDHDLATFMHFIRLWYDGHFIDNLFFAEGRDPAIYRGIISLLAGNTTSLDNQFLAMLNRRILAHRTKTLILN
jgi:flavin-dependent dehydrogenase